MKKGQRNLSLFLLEGKTMTNKFKIIMTTIADEKVADKIAESLIEGKLSPCVQKIKNISSIYQWKGKTVHDDEILLLIKTKDELMEKITELIIKNHTYETPEIAKIDFSVLSEKYLRWFKDFFIE